MNLAGLRERLRACAADRSPRIGISCLYGAYAGYLSLGSLNVLSWVATTMSAQPMRPPIATVPPEWRIPLILLWFLVVGVLGTVVGWYVGSYVNALAQTNPHWALPLLFSVIFLPAACCIVTALLFLIEEDIGGPVAYLLLSAGMSVLVCHSYRRDGWPESMPRG